MHNKLKSEKSPYLLQHSENPVEWFPWCEEAFDKAKKEDKPIFLSIGYSTCHWCHVMAHESFEDSDVALLLNKDFVCIKVDKEERPDVDAVYMDVCQAVTGQGGWPLTIIMTPECKPFFAGTYIPKRTRYGMYGLTELLPMIINQWKSSKQELIGAGNRITSVLQRENTENSAEPSKIVLNKAYKSFQKTFDSLYGGFGTSPKFPCPHNLLFLMRYSQKENCEDALQMAEKTLIQMYKGGIFDHIGGGFSRYSTDEKWLVPHFEKMLYDNALLIYAYTEAYSITKNPLFMHVAEKCLLYVKSEMTDKSGGFYSAQDADSEGVEGKFYVFSPDEILSLLGKENAAYFCNWFNISDDGNFEGKSILNLIDNIKAEEESNLIESLCRTVYEYRIDRINLHKDDKILCSWNSLMITALARAYAVFGNDEYLQLAQNAEHFISQSLTVNNRLYVRYRDSEAAGEGNISDYAFYILSLLELYSVTFDIKYLQKAEQYTAVMVKHFFDNENGGFYLYSDEAEKLITRPKETYDGAIPSGNSAASFALIRLARLTGKKEYQQLSEKQLEFLAGNINDYPSAHTFALLGFMDVLYPSQELVCINPKESDIKKLAEISAAYPSLTIVVKTKLNEKIIPEVVPFTEEYPLSTDQPKYYLCSSGHCNNAVSDIDTVLRMIKNSGS